MELILLYLASEKDITVQYMTAPSTRTRRCFCLSDSKRRTNYGNPLFDQSFHRIRWNLRYERPNLSAISEMMRRRRLFSICEFKPRRTLCDLWWDDRNVYSLQLTFRHAWIEKTTKTFLLSPWHCHRKLLCSFHVFPMQFSPNTKQNANKCFLLISHLKINGLHLSPTNVSTCCVFNTH